MGNTCIGQAFTSSRRDSRASSSQNVRIPHSSTVWSDRFCPPTDDESSNSFISISLASSDGLRNRMSNSDKSRTSAEIFREYACSTRARSSSPVMKHSSAALTAACTQQRQIFSQSCADLRVAADASAVLYSDDTKAATHKLVHNHCKTTKPHSVVATG